MPDKRRFQTPPQVVNRTINQDGSVNGVVRSIDGISGAVSLVAGPNITIADNTPSAGSIKISAAGGGGGSSRTKTTYTATAHVSKTVNADTSVTLTTDATTQGLLADQSPQTLAIAKTFVMSGWLAKQSATSEDPGFFIENGTGGYLLYWDPGGNVILYKYTGSIPASPATAGSFSILDSGASYPNAVGTPMYVEMHVAVFSTTSIVFNMRYGSTIRFYLDTTAFNFATACAFGRMINSSRGAQAYAETFMLSDLFNYPGEIP